MRRFHVLYDFVPSSLSESENKLINFDIVALNLRTKKESSKGYQDEQHTRRITQKMIYRGLALTLV
jgi:hypothetical protein